MQIVYSDKKTGKTGHAQVPKDREAQLIGKNIGEVVEGAMAGLDGFKLKITGLSDASGAPSRKEIDGIRKVKALLNYGTGMKIKGKGFRARRLVRGNSVGPETVQINTVIEQFGTKSHEELFKPKEKSE
ncbi:MAG: S6e family ribosomal protein [Candidatus Micrarchaeia archaeon]